MSTEIGAGCKDAAGALQQVSVMLGGMSEKLAALEAQAGIRPASSNPTNDEGTPSGQEHQRLPWVWVSGETLPYRQLLREAGGRWSRRRQAWYFINCAELPEHLRNLPGTEVTVTY